MYQNTIIGISVDNKEKQFLVKLLLNFRLKYEFQMMIKISVLKKIYF